MRNQYTHVHTHTHAHTCTHTHAHRHTLSLTRTRTGRVGGLGGTRERAMHKQLTYLRAKSRGPQPRGICVCLPPYVSVLPSTTIHNHTHSAHASANISPPPPFLPPMHSTSASAQIWLCITKSATAPVLPVRGGGEGGGTRPYTVTL